MPLLATIVMAVSALTAPACTIPADVLPEQRAGFCELPVAARDYVVRRNTCEHFLGEEPYDEERRREINAAVETYCRGLDAETARLRKRHRDRPAVLRMLDAYGDDVGI
ncbi:hypothetical protein [Montanilutibacter psychrotolerans]|uniref:UrcA family protein n=1 Tax=Montanilutibacter psychrotolerans TaxID=1327343 RepID=A0A3M8T0A1_9GAMM|nr:hypothetical protein [Lysobacter psychrotolerans]RNF86453.1 hypothetical protein EER27_03305 [Lysobacter psychrotolerans]